MPIGVMNRNNMADGRNCDIRNEEKVGTIKKKLLYFFICFNNNVSLYEYSTNI